MSAGGPPPLAVHPQATALGMRARAEVAVLFSMTVGGLTLPATTTEIRQRLIDAARTVQRRHGQAGVDELFRLALVWHHRTIGGKGGPSALVCPVCHQIIDADPDVAAGYCGRCHEHTCAHVLVLRRRSPADAAAYLAGKRAELVGAGQDPTVIDAAALILAEMQQERTR